MIERGVRGFSLIELMLALAIAAVLAALAYPSYARYGYRARRTDAQALLLRIAAAQERYYAGHRQYGKLAELGFDDPARSEHGYYEATLALAPVAEAGEDQSFVATAVPAEEGPQAGDACAALSLDDAGRKWPSADDTAANRDGDCW